MKKLQISPEIELIVSTKSGEASIYYRNTDGEIMAQLNFSISRKQYALAHHTITLPAYQGMGLAKKLVDTFFDFCYRESLIIRATCSYVVHQIQKDDFSYPELLDSSDNSPTLISELKSLSTPAGIERYTKYFKTGRGEYAEGDIFLGIASPTLRRIAKNRRPYTLATILELVRSPYHESRWLGLLCLTQRMQLATTKQQRQDIYNTFLEIISHCNNWDLVDNFGSLIVGMYLYDLPPRQRMKILNELAQSGDLWKERISIVSTQYLIKQGLYEEAFYISKILIEHPHDLIHKAIGWMLREVEKHISIDVLRGFLDKYASNLPRTALRYALEHFSPEERKYYMSIPNKL